MKKIMILCLMLLIPFAHAKDKVFPWQPFSAQAYNQGLRDHQAMYIGFFADWCATCKVVRDTAMKDKKLIELVNKKKIKCMMVDFTDRKPEKLAFLKLFGGSAIPFISLISPDGYVMMKYQGMFTAQDMMQDLDELLD